MDLQKFSPEIEMMIELAGASARLTRLIEAAEGPLKGIINPALYRQEKMAVEAAINTMPPKKNPTSQ